MNESVNSGTSSEMTAGNGLASSVGVGGGSQAYGEAWYWDNRYSQDSSTFDWYQKYPSLAPLIRLYVPRRHPILVVGSGNSAFSEGMADDGYDEIVNIDISSVVIEAMQRKYLSRPQLKYMKMDVRDMSAFDTRSFAAVIDKGTLDSLLCGQNSQHNSSKMLEEVWRVLKDKGVYILITYGSPNYRLPVLQNLNWTIKLHVIEKLQPGNHNNSSNLIPELTSPVPIPIPLDVDEQSFPEAAVGINSDVHYIYVCIKDDSGTG
ncbi:S-adenosyl-L-methionine-dependent methyltransferases superfamily protein [Striga hermonthica]|uniref:S-adenosyl-L-methionine-dependent methyltransferases superfamily protein n=1 Tax=Striga hermonthica TaxID=68872 RepID=A0A9N7RGE5_STRHE|nr:S-adenosyl-L-methionine-dependent methyltransferases superfamily protein [Striga hermonthica]